jgi:hypothetical protein
MRIRRERKTDRESDRETTVREGGRKRERARATGACVQTLERATDVCMQTTLEQSRRVKFFFGRFFLSLFFSCLFLSLGRGRHLMYGRRHELRLYEALSY